MNTRPVSRWTCGTVTVFCTICIRRTGLSVLRTWKIQCAQAKKTPTSECRKQGPRKMTCRINVPSPYSRRKCVKFGRGAVDCGIDMYPYHWTALPTCCPHLRNQVVCKLVFLNDTELCVRIGPDERAPQKVQQKTSRVSSTKKVDM